jgi:hypothetical protein
MTIDRATLLTPLAIKRERVDLPEFGEGQYVWVHGMTAREKTQHDSYSMNSKWDGVNKNRARIMKERMVIFCSRDDDGTRILNYDDTEAVGGWPADTLNRLFDVANTLSGGNTDSEELVKNSDGAEQD